MLQEFLEDLSTFFKDFSSTIFAVFHENMSGFLKNVSIFDIFSKITENMK